MTSRRIWSLLHALLLGVLSACVAESPAQPPSILLFVFDTTREDAVSAYGHVAGTTPTFDALARAGLLYTNAYAQAPWTLPSHVSLFTGLLPSVHGVGWRNLRASDDLVTLAERLRDAGYETVGVSENGWVSAAFNVTQGFERFAAPDTAKKTVDVVEYIKTWLANRHDARPYFLFVNVVDAHAPFEVRATNPYLPVGITATAAKSISQDPGRYFCASEPSDAALAILRGLYLGDVHAADGKLRNVLAALDSHGSSDHLVTVVTADHGELFGEHGLVSHQFSVHEELLHVPLLVHGLPGLAPAVVETPVALIDVVPTLLGAVGITGISGLGPSLPTTSGSVPPRAIVSEFQDLPPATPGPIATLSDGLQAMTRRMRIQCRAEHRVFGDMRAVLELPFKLVWYQQHPAALYDLSIDPGETTDLADKRPMVVEALAANLEHTIGTAAAEQPFDSGLHRDVAPAVVDQLRSLGYLGPDEP